MRPGFAFTQDFYLHGLTRSTPWAYVKLGRLGEAEKIFQRALKGYEKALGPKHPSTLEMVNNLGLLYANMGRLEVAEKKYRRALEGYERALGQEVAKDNIPALNTAEDLVDLFKTTSREEEKWRDYIHAPLSVLKRFSALE